MAHSYGSIHTTGGYTHLGDFNDQSTQYHYHGTQAGAATIAEQLNWLSKLNFATVMQAHCNTSSDKTGQWLLEHSKYQKWAGKNENAERVLWCRGDPGVGKTILCSMVIESLRQNATTGRPVIYCYIDYTRRMDLTADNILANLLRQIFVSRDTDLIDILHKLYESCENGRRKPTYKELQNSFRQSCEKLGRLTVVVDALDECDHAIRRKLITAFDLAWNQKVYFFATSRPHVQLETSTSASIAIIDVHVPRTDLTLFVEDRLADSVDVVRITQSTKLSHDEVVEHILDKAPASFLAAEIFLTSIEHIIVPSELRAALTADLSDPAALYDDTFRRIQSQSPTKAALGLRALGWICIAKRPLTIEELSHAICMSNNGSTFKPDSVPPHDTILDACLGLAKIGGPTNEARLLHYTTAEYLGHKLVTVVDHQIVLESCLRYMSFAMKIALETSNPVQLYFLTDGGQEIQHTAFSAYAIAHWHNHICSELEENHVLIAFLEDDDAVRWWAEEVTYSHYHVRRRRSHESLSSTNVELGLDKVGDEVAQFLLSQGGRAQTLHDGIVAFTQCADPLQRLERTLGVLVTVLARWRNTLAKLLSRRNRFETQEISLALYKAIGDGCQEGVRLLLEYGVVDHAPCIGCHSLLHETPLAHHAISMNQACHLRLLAHYGSDVNRTHCGLTPLQLVLTRTSNPLSDLKHLLASGADVQKRYQGGSTCLHEAMTHRVSVVVVTELLGHGADVQARNNHGDTPLHLAMTPRVSVVVVTELLGHGANVQARNNHGDIPLHLAMQHTGSIDIVELLLAKQGSSVNLRNNYGLTLLHVAVSSRSSEFYCARLLEAGYDVDAMTYEHNTSLMLALKSGCFNSASLLLRSGAETDKEDANGHSLIDQAIPHMAEATIRGQLDRVHDALRCVLLLLSQGARSCSLDGQDFERFYHNYGERRVQLALSYLNAVLRLDDRKKANDFALSDHDLECMASCCGQMNGCFDWDARW